MNKKRKNTLIFVCIESQPLILIKMRNSLITLLVLVPFVCLGQSKNSYSKKPVAYGGESIRLESNSFTSKYLGALEGRPGEEGKKRQSYQGMDIYGNTMVSCQNSGIATVYSFDGKKAVKLSQFDLESANKNNHCNVVSFGVEFAEPSDPTPVMYISHCHRKPINGMKDVLFVERLLPDMKSSKLLQTINFDDVNHLFGYALQWVVDRENNFLYGYGNTIDNTDAANDHRIVKFRLPSITEGVNGLLTLTDKDIIETYLIEDTYAKYYNPIGQGLFIQNDMLFMPTGFGKTEQPSYLYVWDLATRRMRNVLDLREATFSELEDSSMYDGDLIVQTQGSLFRIRFDK